MRQLIAAVLLVCFGMLIPTAASPMRVCFIENSFMEPGFVTYGETASHKLKCCPECGTSEKDDSCCMEVKKLPDAPTPSAPTLVFTPVFFLEQEFFFALPPSLVVELKETFVASTPIRGPDSPGSRRAVLGIWNI